MNRFIHRSILLPAFETVLKRRKTFRYWAELERTQWLAHASIEALQFRALRRLVSHAFERCPYYRESWARLGLLPNRLTSTTDIQRWPVIDRDTIRVGGCGDTDGKYRPLARPTWSRQYPLSCADPTGASHARDGPSGEYGKRRVRSHGL